MRVKPESAQSARRLAPAGQPTAMAYDTEKRFSSGFRIKQHQDERRRDAAGKLCRYRICEPETKIHVIISRRRREIITL
jgi:hypothetical protein